MLSRLQVFLNIDICKASKKISYLNFFSGLEEEEGNGEKEDIYFVANCLRRILECQKIRQKKKFAASLILMQLKPFDELTSQCS
jgi:hypothetical protein